MSCWVFMMTFVCQVWWLPYMWCHRYSGCDDTHTVAVMSNIVGEMTGIVVVLSWKQYGWYHGWYTVSSDAATVDAMSDILGVMTWIQCVWYHRVVCYHKECTWWHTYATCDVLDSCCDVFDKVGIMTYIVDMMADRIGFNSDIELVLSVYTQCLWHYM